VPLKPTYAHENEFLIITKKPLTLNPAIEVVAAKEISAKVAAGRPD
jgi:hypothetical protein